MNAEPPVQPRFSIAALLGAAAIVASLLVAHWFFAALPDREERGARTAELRFEPTRLDADGFTPLRLVGAWTVTGDDRRIGGISAVAVEGDSLVALTDSGVVVRFPKPAAKRALAEVRELPGGPGDPGFKADRDSEAIVRDPVGRGWWVAFENDNQLWLYDARFARPLARTAIPRRGLAFNTGIEGMALADGGLLLLPERGGRVLRFGASGWAEMPFAFPARRASAATALPDGSLLVVERRLTLRGFANSLARLERCDERYCLTWRKRLPLGPFDNVEALAAEPLTSGATRLWLMTDDNDQRPLRTLLIAVEL